jgi:hypothetical protein
LHHHELGLADKDKVNPWIGIVILWQPNHSIATNSKDAAQTLTLNL